MVRIKYRYFGIKIESERNVKISPDSYKKIINDLVTENYGIKIASHLRSLYVLDTLQENNVCFFRVVRMIAKEVSDSLLKCDNLNGMRARILVLAVSGSIRNARKKFLDKFNYKMSESV